MKNEKCEVETVKSAARRRKRPGKIRSDSIWNWLAPERREQFDRWLLVERVSYDEARTRAQREWNVTGSLMSICRYYWRALGNREAGELDGLKEAANAVKAAGVDPELLRDS